MLVQKLRLQRGWSQQQLLPKKHTLKPNILMEALPYWKCQPGKKPLNGQERLQFLADASKNCESFNLTLSLENLKLKH
jgi:hypothetical protein